MRAIVLTFDRLPAHLLSCLGNEWMETPEFDRLAAVSRVFEQHYVEIPAPAGPAHPWWTGRYEFFDDLGEGQSPDTEANPLRRLRAAGVTTSLITERREGLPVELFDECLEVNGEDGLKVEADKVPFARLISEAIRQLQAPSTSSQLLWLHSRGIPDPWTPPQFFAELYLDEMDADPLNEAAANDDDDDSVPTPNSESEPLGDVAREFIEQLADDSTTSALVLSDQLFDVDREGDNEHQQDGDDHQGSDTQRSESHSVDDDVDPSLQRQLRRVAKFVCGGYVTLLDHWFGKLFSVLAATDEPTLLIVTAAQGQAFAEREAFQTDAQLQNASAQALANGDLQDALVKTPLFVWLSDKTRYGSRHQEFCQPQDVPMTLLDWFKVGDDAADVDSTSTPTHAAQRRRRQSLLQTPSRAEAREHVVHLTTYGAIGYRDSQFLLVAADIAALHDRDAESSDSLSLFIKPSDAWNLCDVANQSTDDVERLVASLATKLRDTAFASNS